MSGLPAPSRARRLAYHQEAPRLQQRPHDNIFKCRLRRAPEQVGRQRVGDDLLAEQPQEPGGQKPDHPCHDLAIAYQQQRRRRRDAKLLCEEWRADRVYGHNAQLASM